MNDWTPKHWNWKYSFFIRPKDLIEADKLSTTTTSGNNGNNISMKEGKIDGHNYLCKLSGAKLTAYGGGKNGNNKIEAKKTVASHNLPRGTQVYIPGTKGNVSGNNGIWEVQDTGSHCFDFDLYLADTDSAANNLWAQHKGNKRCDAYVIKWGTGPVTWSYTEAIEYYNKNGNYNNKPGAYKYHTAWKDYISTGGVLINLWQFKQDDKYIKNKSWFNNI